MILVDNEGVRCTKKIPTRLKVGVWKFYYLQIIQKILRFLSIQETAGHASYTYKSTIAVTYLTE